MTKRIIFHGTDIHFPSACVVCEQLAVGGYPISRTLSADGEKTTISLSIPLCRDHYNLADRKSVTDRGIGRLGLLGGLLQGIFVAAGLWIYWASTGQGSPGSNLALALGAGLGIFLTIWLFTTYWLAPLFGDREAETAQQAVRIRHFWPDTQNLQLEFDNDLIAELVAVANRDRVVKRE
jgi:hypothetical protein